VFDQKGCKGPASALLLAPFRLIARARRQGTKATTPSSSLRWGCARALAALSRRRRRRPRRRRRRRPPPTLKEEGLALELQPSPHRRPATHRHTRPSSNDILLLLEDGRPKIERESAPQPLDHHRFRLAARPEQLATDQQPPGPLSAAFSQEECRPSTRPARARPAGACAAGERATNREGGERRALSSFFSPPPRLRALAPRLQGPPAPPDLSGARGGKDCCPPRIARAAAPAAAPRIFAGTSAMRERGPPSPLPLLLTLLLLNRLKTHQPTKQPPRCC
jgi:hypothetical protein